MLDCFLFLSEHEDPTGAFTRLDGRNALQSANAFTPRLCLALQRTCLADTKAS